MMDDLKVSYSILQDMHDLILKYEPFPYELVEEGKTAIQILKMHKPEDYELRRIIDDTREILEGQLKLNKEIKRLKEKIWQQHIGEHRLAKHKS